MQPDWLKQQLTAQKRPESQAQTEKEPTSGFSRRDFLHGGVLAGVSAGLAAGALVAQHQAAHAQPASSPAANPLGKEWWPSPWGAADERGATNRITRAKVLRSGQAHQNRQDLHARAHLCAGYAPLWVQTL